MVTNKELKDADLKKYIESIKQIPFPTDKQLVNYIEYLSKKHELKGFFGYDEFPRERLVIFPLANILTTFKLNKEKNKFVPIRIEKMGDMPDRYKFTISHTDYVSKFGHLSFKVMVHGIVVPSGGYYYLLKGYGVTKNSKGDLEMKLNPKDRFYLPLLIRKNAVRLSKKFFGPGNEEYKEKKKKELFNHVKKILNIIKELKKKIK